MSRTPASALVATHYATIDAADVATVANIRSETDHHAGSVTYDINRTVNSYANSTAVYATTCAAEAVLLFDNNSEDSRIVAATYALHDDDDSTALAAVPVEDGQ